MDRGLLAVGDKVRLIRPSGQGKTYAPAGACGSVMSVFKGGEKVFVTFNDPRVRNDYIHPVDVADLEFESPLDKFTRGLA